MPNLRQSLCAVAVFSARAQGRIFAGSFLAERAFCAGQDGQPLPGLALRLGAACGCSISSMQKDIPAPWIGEGAILRIPVLNFSVDLPQAGADCAGQALSRLREEFLAAAGLDDFLHASPSLILGDLRCAIRAADEKLLVAQSAAAGALPNPRKPGL